MTRHEPRHGNVVAQITRRVGQRVTHSRPSSSSSFSHRELSTSVATQSSSENNSVKSGRNFSSKNSYCSGNTWITSSISMDSRWGGESIKSHPKDALDQWKTNFAIGRQNSNADCQIRNTLADIRRSLEAIPQKKQDCVCGELYQECDDLDGAQSVLVDLLQDIRDSLRAMPPDEVQPRTELTTNNDVADTDLMKILEDIREGVLSLQETTKGKMGDDKTLNSKTTKSTPRSESNLYGESLLMDAIFDIRKGVAALVDNVKAQETKEINEVFEAVGDIRRSLQTVIDGDMNKPSTGNFNKAQTNELLEKSVNAIVQSINGLVGTVKTISHALEAKNEEPDAMRAKLKKQEEVEDNDTECGENSRRRKKKIKGKRSLRQRRGGDSTESECTCEKLIKYLMDRKGEPARPCQYVLPSIEPPSIFIAPVCRPPPPPPPTSASLSLPPPQPPSVSSQPAPPPPTSQASTAPPPIICLPMTCCQASQPTPMAPSCQHQYQPPSPTPNPCCQHLTQNQPQSPMPCRNYRVQSPAGSKGRLVKSLPTSFTLSFAGNADQKCRTSDETSTAIPDYANRIFLCRELDS